MTLGKASNEPCFRSGRLKSSLRSMRVYALFTVNYVFVIIAIHPLINVWINFARCFTLTMREKYAECTDKSYKFEATLSQKLRRAWQSE